MKKLSYICLLFLSLIYCRTEAGAAGIGIKPDKINISGAAGKALSQEILVFNAGEAPGMYVLSPDDEMDLIAIEPKEFVLEAGAERLVKITAKSYFPKTANTAISVISRPLDASGFSAAAGVKIPFQARYYLSRTQIIILALCFALVIMILYRLMRTKKEKS